MLESQLSALDQEGRLLLPAALTRSDSQGPHPNWSPQATKSPERVRAPPRHGTVLCVKVSPKKTPRSPTNQGITGGWRVGNHHPPASRGHILQMQTRLPECPLGFLSRNALKREMRARVAISGLSNSSLSKRPARAASRICSGNCSHLSSLTLRPLRSPGFSLSGAASSPGQGVGAQGA